jgi:hypothetical protein
MHIFCENG